MNYFNLARFRGSVLVSLKFLFSDLGSMPPDSHSIFEEGAVFKSFKIVKEGVFQEEGKTRNKLVIELLDLAIVFVDH